MDEMTLLSKRLEYTMRAKKKKTISKNRLKERGKKMTIPLMKNKMSYLK